MNSKVDYSLHGQRILEARCTKKEKRNKKQNHQTLHGRFETLRQNVLLKCLSGCLVFQKMQRASEMIPVSSVQSERKTDSRKTNWKYFFWEPAHGTTVAPACCKPFSQNGFPHPEIIRKDRQTVYTSRPTLRAFYEPTRLLYMDGSRSCNYVLNRDCRKLTSSCQVPANTRLLTALQKHYARLHVM